ncbi:MAG: PEP-utilizing enzyme [Patescibacteria group bacterium]|jgi:phosphohistidine swiveling domain-containing protein/IS30 family transposase|nr:PEP-utilizing enzyme [Patescibacteria group bacterium]
MKNNIKLKDFVFMSQRQRTSPFPNYLSMEAMCDESRRYVGQRLKEMLCIWQGNLFFAFPHKLSYEKSGKQLVKKILVNRRWPAQMVASQKKYGKVLVEFTKKIHQSVGSKTTNRQLAKMFEDYEKRYKPVYATYGWVWLVEDFFMAELLKLVESKIKNPNQAVDILNILTKQPKAMVALIERKALLELAVKIGNKPGWKTNQSVVRLINSHIRKYFWVTRDYEDPAISHDDVVRRLADLFRKDYRREYQRLVGALKKDNKLQKKYLNTLGFSVTEKELFGAMRDIANLKELRKTHVSQSLYYFDKVLEEIARRLFLSIRQVRFMKTVEIRQALIEGKDFTAELNNRLRLSAWDCRTAKTEIFTGYSAEKIFKEFCKVDKNIKEFFGLPVSPGKARGKVKIVMNPDECDKVQKGDIIVTVQVVPSFSTAIIKSAGLICDGGHGITSHPATLAREAGIPCVIQTRFAREVLQDGDEVEVDGYAGIARIVKRQ